MIGNTLVPTLQVGIVSLKEIEFFSKATRICSWIDQGPNSITTIY